MLATVLLPLAGIALIWVFGSPIAQCLLQRAAMARSCDVAWSRSAAAGMVAERRFVVRRPAEIAAWRSISPGFDSYGVEVHFALGLDGLSVWLFGLSALLTLTSVLVSWEAIDDRAPAFYALLLLLETGMLGVFAARDMILFYIFFEFTLIPLFFMIGIWGSEDRRYAAIKFFLFTLAGSLLTFLGLLAIVLWNFYHASRRRADFSFAGVTEGAGQRIRSARLAIVDLPGAVCRLCHQGAAVPAAHLAAARAHASPHGRQRAVGRHPAEDRHLRLPAFQPADAPRCRDRLHALGLGAFGGRHRLRGAGRAWRRAISRT